MQATFTFAQRNLGDKPIIVNAFNSVTAALAYSEGECLLSFSHNEADWIAAGEQDRDVVARRKWINQCYQEQARLNGLIPEANGPAPCTNSTPRYNPKAIDESENPLFDLLPQKSGSGEGYHTFLPGEQYTIPTVDYLNSFQCIVSRVHAMGVTFEVPMNDTPTDVGHQRIEGFINNLAGPDGEVWELRTAVSKYPEEDGYAVDLTVIADTLGDIIVYCLSEANRWGIPIVEVLHAILDSQNSKLVDGKPLWNENRTKFIKGPHYVAPEPKIKEIIEQHKLVNKIISCAGDIQRVLESDLPEKWE